MEAAVLASASEDDAIGGQFDLERSSPLIHRFRLVEQSILDEFLDLLQLLATQLFV